MINGDRPASHQRLATAPRAGVRRPATIPGEPGDATFSRALNALGSRASFAAPVLVWRGDSGLIEAVSIHRPFVIGYSPTCDLILGDGERRLRLAVLVPDRATKVVRLEALDPLAGVQVNGRLATRRPVGLSDGDVIQIGNNRLAYFSPEEGSRTSRSR